MSRKVFIIAFIAILALVCLVACKQEVTNNSNKLYGTWTGSFSIESYKFTVSDGTHFTLEESFEIWGHKETDTIKGTYQFTSDTEGTLTADVNDSLEFSRFFDDDGGLEHEDITEILNLAGMLNPATVKIAQLKEFWYIDKQDTRQKVRIVGMSFMYKKNVIKAGQEDTETDWTFWIPMDFMTVRQVLVNANAYDENNDVAERSYDDIFVERYFDSYITRESNVHNREITKYLTGVDAIYESQMIEEKIFDIESDMWEY